MRLLEAHMTHLRGSFKSWKFAQPEEPENEHQTEEELEEFTKADDAHKKQVRLRQSKQVVYLMLMSANFICYYSNVKSLRRWKV